MIPTLEEYRAARNFIHKIEATLNWHRPLFQVYVDQKLYDKILFALITIQKHLYKYFREEVPGIQDVVVGNTKFVVG